jgi:hypothetical protein
MKKVIVSGCSFTFEDWNWPKYLIKHLNVPTRDLINVGMASQGNGLISKKLIYSVNKELENTDSKDLLVGVMWSGVDRVDFHSENNYSSENWGNNGHVSNIQNPTKVAKDRKWYFINPGWDTLNDPHPLMESYYRYFHSDIGVLLSTIQSILLVQWYLKERGVKYFMTTYLDIFGGYPKELMESEEIKYMFNLIDHERFLPVSGCYEYLRDNFPEGVPSGKGGNHPYESGHQYFTENIILPFLDETQSNTKKPLI